MLSWLLFSNTSCRTGSSCDLVFFSLLFFFFLFSFCCFGSCSSFLGGGEEKGTVAEVYVTRGVRVCRGACVCVHASPEEGLRLCGGLVKRFPHPRWMLRTQPMGVTEKDRTVSDVLNNKPTFTDRKSVV